jgi:hypothetical protein
MDGLVMAVQSLDRLCRSVGGDLADVVPELCDGSARSYDGHRLVWAAYSRNPHNGWHDPTCRDIAGPHGLCDTCLTRMNRWRKSQGLTPVGVKAAA